MHFFAKVKLRLFILSVLEKLALSTRVITAMTGNPNFPDADPLLAAAQTAQDNLESAKTTQDVKRLEAQSATEAVHNQQEVLDKALRALGNHVDNVAEGDAEIIESAGMESFFPGKAPDVGPLERVTGLEALPGAGEGMVVLDWNPLTGAKSYHIQFATAEGEWTTLANTTASQFTAMGLASGTKHWFRVAGVGAAGQGPFSDPATIFVP